MNLIEGGYCRLCGCDVVESRDKFVHMQESSDTREEILKQLVRVNAAVDFTIDILPKIVCSVCVNSLRSAFEFVSNVERVQDNYWTILGKRVKIEETNVPHEVEFTLTPLVGMIKKEDEETTPSAELMEKSESENESEQEIHCNSAAPNIVPNQVNPIILSPAIETLKIETQDVLTLPSDESMNKSNSENESESDRESCQTLTLPKISSKKISLQDTAPETLERTWKDYNWKCSYCEAVYSTVEELRNHSMQNHQSCSTFKCTDCRTRASILSNFTRHVKMHHEHLKLSCHFCFKRFSCQSETRKHLRQHLETTHSCKGCNKSFKNKTELDVHTKTYLKSIKVRPFKDLMKHTDDLTCLLCQRTFISKVSLQAHLLTHTDRERNHICHTCGKGFWSKYILAGHMIIHDDSRPFQCHVCKAFFKTSNILRTHIKTHDTSKQFDCDRCGRSFKMKRHLAAHSLIHSDSTPHVCEYCKKAFPVKRRLTLHLRRHTGEKPYSCDICQRGFTHWGNYNKHMKDMHGINIAKTKRTPAGVFPIDPQSGEPVVPPQTEHGNRL